VQKRSWRSFQRSHSGGSTRITAMTDVGVRRERTTILGYSCEGGRKRDPSGRERGPLWMEGHFSLINYYRRWVLC
jgi:hypothetical protein